MNVQGEGVGLDDMVQEEGAGQGEGAGRQEQGRGSEGTDSRGKGHQGGYSYPLADPRLVAQPSVPIATAH